MFQNVRLALKGQSKLILLITGIFAVSLLAGMATATWGSESVASWATADDAARSQQIEGIFGRFREPVRDGDLMAIATCVVIVFGLNALGAMSEILLTAFVVPFALYVFAWWTIGISLSSVQGTSLLSVSLYLLIGSVEWFTYILGASAGLNIGLAVISPQRLECTSRWPAFKRAFAQAGNLYLMIVLILGIQAIVEVLYVRKVLLMGGTGVPLAPW